MADNCSSQYANASTLGAPLFVDLPGDAHDAAPTDYALTDTTTGTSEPVCVFDAQSTVTPFLSSAVLLPLHPLERGDSFTGHYTAGGVTGSWSFSVALRPPSTLLDVDLLANGNREATIGWTPPLDDGGSRVTGYDVEHRAVGTSTWSQPDPDFVDDTSTRQTVGGLANGRRYYFRVAAVNAVGPGAFTVSDQYATPGQTPPDAPTAVAGTAGNGRIHLTWHAPSNTGGTPITSYVISSSMGGRSYRAVPGQITGTSTTLTGLANGTPYRFEVAATNSLGTGSNSAASAAITPQPDRPGRVQLVSALPGKASATVSWLRPVSDGNGALTGYLVQYSSDGTTWTSVPHHRSSTTQVVTGLTNGTKYRFRVAAVNAAACRDIHLDRPGRNCHGRRPGSPWCERGPRRAAPDVALRYRHRHPVLGRAGHAPGEGRSRRRAHPPERVAPAVAGVVGETHRLERLHLLSRSIRPTTRTCGAQRWAPTSTSPR